MLQAEEDAGESDRACRAEGSTHPLQHDDAADELFVQADQEQRERSEPEPGRALDKSRRHRPEQHLDHERQEEERCRPAPPQGEQAGRAQQPLHVHGRPGEDIAEALREVSESAKSQSGFDGLDKFFPSHAREHLADMLLYALSQAKELTGRTEVSHIIEITEDGWIVTDEGLRPRSVPFYLISFNDRALIDWTEHILNKPWNESAAFPHTFSWALALYDRMTKQGGA